MCLIDVFAELFILNVVGYEEYESKLKFELNLRWLKRQDN
jgi:hypothetical protein